MSFRPIKEGGCKIKGVGLPNCFSSNRSSFLKLQLTNIFSPTKGYVDYTAFYFKVKNRDKAGFLKKNREKGSETKALFFRKITWYGIIQGASCFFMFAFLFKLTNFIPFRSNVLYKPSLVLFFKTSRTWKYFLLFFFSFTFTCQWISFYSDNVFYIVRFDWTIRRNIMRN